MIVEQRTNGRRKEKVVERDGKENRQLEEEVIV